MGFRVANLTTLQRVYRGACVRRPFAGDLAALPDQIFSLRHHRGDHDVIAKRWHMGHSHGHGHDHGPGAAEGVFGLGLAADVALAVGKSVAGYLSGSTAVVADAAHSISDIVLSGVAWLSYRAATVPKDEEHPYGMKDWIHDEIDVPNIITLKDQWLQHKASELRKRSEAK